MTVMITFECFKKIVGRSRIKKSETLKKISIKDFFNNLENKRNFEELENINIL